MTSDVEETELLEQTFGESTSFKNILEKNVLDEDEDVVEVPFGKFKEQSFRHMSLMIDVDELEDVTFNWFDNVPRTEAIETLNDSLLVELGMRFSDLRSTVNSIYQLSMGCELDSNGNLVKGVKIVGGEDE
jgi:hypothetical protein